MIKNLGLIALFYAMSTTLLTAGVTANLVVTLPDGEDDPQSPADGGLSTSYGQKSITRFIIKAGTGNVKFNNDAANSGAPEIKAYGDLLDVLGEGNSLPGSPLSYIPDVDETIIVTLNTENPDGASARTRADSGKGFGVGGGNPTRIDWRFDKANSEGIRIDVDATALPETHRVVISSLTFGNGTPVGDILPTVTDFAGGAVTSAENVTSESNSVLELSSAHELLGGRFGQIWVRQSVKPEAADWGFSLQGITLDVLPYYGDWAGYYWSDAAGDTDTQSFLGWVNVANPNWVWSYNYAAWFYVEEEWVTHNGSWAYMPVASELALGDVSYVEPDLMWVESQEAWVYRPSSTVSESGSWIFIFDL